MTVSGIRGQKSDGETWIPVAVNDSGAIDVTLQDQHTQIVTMIAMNETGDITLDGDVAIDDYTFDLVAAHGVIVGDTIEFYEGTRFFQAGVITVATDTITLDVPFDFAFTAAGATGKKGSHEMAVNGSVTPVIFRVTSKYLQAGSRWDITTFAIAITDQTAMDDAKFGGISALARGVLFRVKDGIYKNLFVAKTNGDIFLGFDMAEYSLKAPAGFFGITAQKNIGGQSNLGVVVRLTAETSDEMQIIIQDDLTDLDHVHVFIAGSEVLD